MAGTIYPAATANEKGEGARGAPERGGRVKSRKLRLTIEITTDVPLMDLRGAKEVYLSLFSEGADCWMAIDHIQVNAIRPAKAAKKGGK